MWRKLTTQALSSVQSLGHVQLCDAMHCGTPGFLSITNSRSLLKLMSTESVMPSNHLILCCPFSSCLQSFPASRSFPMSQPFATHGQNIGVSASASVLTMNIQDWFPLGSTGWISLQSKRLWRVFSNTTVQKHQFFMVQLSHPYMTTGKTTALTRWTLVGKVMSLLFNMLVRLVITFLPRSKRLLISWLKSPSAVILEPPKIKSVIVSIVSPSISHEVIEPDAKILVFWTLSFKPVFLTLFFHFHQEAL